MTSAVNAVVLVEGHSDRVALETLAARRGFDLGAAGVAVVAMGGATNAGRNIEQFRTRDVVLAALCDAREEPRLRRALERSDIDSFALFVCDADLEDELIRALGVTAVERVIDAEGELPSLRILQQQPAQRDRTAEQHLHRFMGSRSRRKARYARLLVDALDLADVPRPLDAVLDYVTRTATR